jgi:glycosyltransferase involved in cell wall biosynthesis
MRVAFIGGRGVISKYSGVETYYEEVGERLAKMGHEITIYCRRHFTPPIATYNGMRLVHLPTFHSKHLETLVHTLLSTAHAMFSDCDVVHYHAQGPALFSLFPRLIGKKTVVTVQGQIGFGKMGWAASCALRLGEVSSAVLPNRTVVVSRVLQHRYRTAYGTHALYIPNGTTIRPSKTPSPLLSKWGLEPDNYVLFLGRFSPEKNCHLLIEAFEQLETGSKLALAGGSSHTDAYASKLRQHSSERVLFLDWVQGPVLDELLTNAALFVLPSDLEGLSLALLDAMGAAVCVLTSDIPENLEVVEGAGFTFRAGNVADLARMLRLLLSDPLARQTAGQNAQARVRDRYLWPGIATQIASLYAELIGGSSHAISSVSVASAREEAAKRAA